MTKSVAASPQSFIASLWVSVRVSPFTRLTFAFTSPVSATACRPPVRISGPLVSSITLRSMPPGPSKGYAAVVRARFFKRSCTSSSVACEKLMRITDRPERTTAGSVSASSEAGPIVATIFDSGKSRPLSPVWKMVREGAMARGLLPWATARCETDESPVRSIVRDADARVAICVIYHQLAAVHGLGECAAQ